MLEHIEKDVFVSALILLISLSVTFFLMRRIQIIDVPEHRSSHKVATPRSGGLAILSAFTIGMLIWYLLGRLGHPSPERMIYFSCAVGLSTFCFLYDDIKGVSAWLKFMVQIAAGMFLVASGLVLHALPVPLWGTIPLGELSGVWTILIIVLATNVFNFMDGLNGLAGGSSCIACVFMALISYQGDAPLLFYASLTLLFATLGFLCFNFPKGLIFMGDVGSQFLGFIWGVMFLLAAHYHEDQISLYTVPLIFLSFMYEVLYTLIRRTLQRKKIWIAHRTHLFQILNRKGFSHRAVSMMSITFFALHGLVALMMQSWPTHYQALVFWPLLGLQIGYNFWVLRFPHRARDKKALAQTAALRDNSHTST